MRIRHFTARHCGSAHDARIFQESDLRIKLEQDFNSDRPRILIGDEGYPCSRILLTPIRDDRVRTPNQTNYNKALSRARIIVEHTFGVLKRRFPALLYQSRCRLLANTQALIGNSLNLTLLRFHLVNPMCHVESQFNALRLSNLTHKTAEINFITSVHSLNLLCEHQLFVEFCYLCCI